MALATNVKNFLKSKHITVPEEWIGPCLEFIQVDNPGLNLSNTRLVYEKVYEQWLHSDLTELASCCLPFGLVQKKSTMLNGQFVLQINHVRDVGNPAYGQLQKLRKSEGVNASVSAEKQFQPLWEPKPSRMLMMQMTDGTSVVQGMEYNSIPHLNVNVKPGTKVLVSGAVKCRRGVLFLTRDNITILGGATESLSITNAVENVLARALGAEETDEPKELLETEATQIPPSQRSQYYPSQVNRAPPVSQNRPIQQPVRDRGGGNSRPISSKQKSLVPAPPPPPVIDDMDDDFLDSDMEAALNQIESQASSASYNESRIPQASSSKTMIKGNVLNTKKVNNDVRFNTNKSNVNKSTPEIDMEGCEEFFDDFDDELMISAESSIQQTSVQALPTWSRKTVSGVSSASTKSPSTSMNVTSSKPARPPPLFGSQNNFPVPNRSTPIGAVVPQKINKSNPSTSSLSQKNNAVAPKQSRLTSFMTKRSRNEENSVSSRTQNNHSMDFDGMEDAFAEPFEVDFNLDDGSLVNGSDTKRRKSVLQEESVTDLVRKDPFTYLYCIPERPTEMQEYVVKGFIMTLVSKLEVVLGNWKLTAVINDGSASREVDIDNKILVQFIGLTCSDFQSKKREAKFNPALQQQLSRSVVSCQKKLISLCCLLRLRLEPGQRMKLIEIIPVKSSTALELSKRSPHL